MDYGQDDSTPPEARRLSRRSVIGATGAAGAGLIAGGLAPAGVLAESGAEAAKLSQKDAAQLIADLITGKAKPPYHDEHIRVLKHLREPGNASKVFRRLEKMRNPIRRASGPEARQSDDVDSPPTNRMSFDVHWYGYVLEIPAAVFPALEAAFGSGNPARAVADLVNQQAGNAQPLLGQTIFVVMLAHLITFSPALKAISDKSHKGAGLRAARVYPYTWFPTNF